LPEALRAQGVQAQAMDPGRIALRGGHTALG
jgi:hypothetical protein